MPLFLGHSTAEFILDRPHAGRLVPALDQSLEHCWASRRDISQADLGMIADVPLPLDVLVSSNEDRRRWEGIRCHVCPPDLPATAFLEVAPDIFVSSPALCLIQRAQQLSLAQTIALGSRFCGTYALDRQRPTGIRERLPIASIEDLRTFIDRCPPTKGLKRARRASSLILQNSASPMETVTALVLCLPHRLGGLGLPLPQLNYEVTLHADARKLTAKRFIRIDLYWRDCLFGIEYQGLYAHDSAGGIAADIARQLAAEAMGIELCMVTIEQIREREQRLAVARKVATRLGVPFAPRDDLLIANQHLVDDLLTRAVAHNSREL